MPTATQVPVTGPQKLSEMEQAHIHALVYGQTGVGKTIFACGSQKLRTFLFDIDNGAISALAWRGVKNDQITRYRCKGREDFQAALGWLTAHKSEFDLCVVDTATELQGLIVQEICQIAKVETAGQREWGLILQAMRRITRAFLDLNMHVVFLAHEEQALDEQTRRISYKPDFQGRYSKEYSKWFSLIARYTVQEKPVKGENGQPQMQTIRGLQCHKTPYVEAKDRSDALTKSGLEEPLIDPVFDKFLVAVGIGR